MWGGVQRLGDSNMTAVELLQSSSFFCFFINVRYIPLIKASLLFRLVKPEVIISWRWVRETLSLNQYNLLKCFFFFLPYSTKFVVQIIPSPLIIKLKNELDHRALVCLILALNAINVALQKCSLNRMNSISLVLFIFCLFYIYLSMNIVYLYMYIFIPQHFIRDLYLVIFCTGRDWKINI